MSRFVSLLIVAASTLPLLTSAHASNLRISDTIGVARAVMALEERTGDRAMDAWFDRFQGKSVLMVKAYTGAFIVNVAIEPATGKPVWAKTLGLIGRDFDTEEEQRIDSFARSPLSLGPTLLANAGQGTSFKSAKFQALGREGRFAISHEGRSPANVARLTNVVRRVASPTHPDRKA